VFNVEYFPLKAGTSQGRLELTSTDLGLYLYDLELKAAPSAPEKALNFQTCLGSSQTLTAKFVSFAKHKTDYTCKVYPHTTFYYRCRATLMSDDHYVLECSLFKIFLSHFSDVV